MILQILKNSLQMIRSKNNLEFSKFHSSPPHFEMFITFSVTFINKHFVLTNVMLNPYAHFRFRGINAIDVIISIQLI